MLTTEVNTSLISLEGTKLNLATHIRVNCEIHITSEIKHAPEEIFDDH